MPFVSRGTLGLARVLAVSRFGSVVLAHATRGNPAAVTPSWRVSAPRCFAVSLYRGALNVRSGGDSERLANTARVRVHDTAAERARACMRPLQQFAMATGSARYFYSSDGGYFR